MMKKEIDDFVNSQQSIHLYKNVQKALTQVLSRMSEDDFKKATSNIILMVLHEGAYGQVMHFEKKNKFQIMQLTIPRKMPMEIIRYVIAHEFGHVFQGRNWEKDDGQKLEVDADIQAKKWGFVRTEKMTAWMTQHDKKLS